MKTHFHHTKEHGYIALMATIIIAAVLLVMSVEGSIAGWRARFNVLGTEAKEQASALAQGCADQALSAIMTDPSYTGDATTTTDVGTCHVFPIEFNFPIEGVVSIRTQAVVRGSYANLEMQLDMSDIHIDSVPAAPTKGTIVVITNVVNDGEGALHASDFTMHTSGGNPTLTSFAGSESGVIVRVDPGAYSITEDSVSGYATSFSTNCSGSIDTGDIAFCTVTNDDITTTLTILVNVINDNGGTRAYDDFPVYIDGDSADPGTAYTVTPGSHTASADTIANYTASVWGYQCDSDGDVNVPEGQSKTCIINYNDNPPPSPSCADTVMMLDRSYSMFGYPDYPSGYTRWIPDEKTAAKSLIDLYSGVTPNPKMSFGRFGDVATGRSAEIISQLSTSYSAMKTAIDNGLPSNPISYTNLEAAISKARAELNSARHTPGKEKVIIMVSDGEPNEPSGTSSFDTGFLSPTVGVQDSLTSLWSNPANAYTDGNGDASGVVTGSTNRERYYSFNIRGGAGLPSGATVNGIQIKVDAYNTVGGGVPTNTTVAPTSLATYDQWTSNTGTDVNAVSANDNDTTYIDTATNLETFTVANAGIPAGATINSVTLNAVAKSASANGTMQLVTEKGGTVNVGSNITLSTAYTTYTRTLNTDPSTGNPWTLAEVNAWTNKFGVRSTNSGNVPRVTQFSVTINYTPIPPASTCQLGVDLSWNGGANWTSEKTQNLTNTETTYTLGATNDDWRSGSWSPGDFSNANFRARVRAIDPGSGCDNSAIDHLDWLQMNVRYTQNIDPTEAALNAADSAKIDGINLFTIHFGADPSGYMGKELLANLASGGTAVSGHQNGSYADPSSVTSGNTGYVSPTAQASASGGDGNGYETTPAEAFGDGGDYARNIDGAGDKHIFGGYNLVIPPGATIVGIQTRLDWWTESTSGNNSMSVDLSWNGGTTWTSTKTEATESTTQVTRTLGGSADTWGRSWTTSDFSGSNFKVRVTSNCTGNANPSCTRRDFYLDWIPVTVYYTVNTENGDDDNFFVSPSSADMKGIFDYIGKEVCPAIGFAEATEPPTTGSLTVITQVVNNNDGASTPEDISISVSPSSATPNSFDGSTGGTVVVLNPGSYTVQGTVPDGYVEVAGAGCSSASTGNITAGESRMCVLTYDDIPPPPPPPDLTIHLGSWKEVPIAE